MQCRGGSHNEVVQDRLSFQVNLQVSFGSLSCNNFISTIVSNIFVGLECDRSEHLWTWDCEMICLSCWTEPCSLTSPDWDEVLFMVCQYPTGKSGSAHPLFAELLERSLCKQEDMRAWCPHCRAYVPLQQVSALLMCSVCPVFGCWQRKTTPHRWAQMQFWFWLQILDIRSWQ